MFRSGGISLLSKKIKIFIRPYSITGHGVCTTKISPALPDTEILPILNSIDVVKTTTWLSPYCNRETCTLVILLKNYHRKFHISINNSSSDIGKKDPYMSSFDYFGAFIFTLAMKMNVSFDSIHKFTYSKIANAPYSRDCKFKSQILPNSHYSNLIFNSRSNWHRYDRDATITNRDSSFLCNLQTKRKYGKKSDQSTKKPQSKQEQIKTAFKDYGSAIVIFHIVMSLTSLGGFYLLVSSGVDLTSLLQRFDSAPDALKNNVAIGAGNFVISYAIHKMFAPVRMSITLGATPFIVRYLRKIKMVKKNLM